MALMEILEMAIGHPHNPKLHQHKQTPEPIRTIY
jgi:hypothetical protein